MTPHTFRHSAETLKSLMDEASQTVPHLVPIFMAIRHGVRLTNIDQRARSIGTVLSPFAIGNIVLIGDDTEEGSLGSRQYETLWLQSILHCIYNVAIISCAPFVGVYRSIAVDATLGINGMIIETRPEHESAWFNFVHQTCPKLPVLRAVVKGTMK